VETLTLLAILLKHHFLTKGSNDMKNCAILANPDTSKEEKTISSRLEDIVICVGISEEGVKLSSIGL